MAISFFEGSDHLVMKRVFADQLNGTIAFPEAEDIIWQLSPQGDHNYKLVTSDYWITKEDFLSMEFEGEGVAYVEQED